MQKVVAVSLDSRCSNAFLTSSATISRKGELQKHWRVCIQLHSKSRHCTAIGVVYIQVAPPLSRLQKHWWVLNPTSKAATAMYSTSSLSWLRRHHGGHESIISRHRSDRRGDPAIQSHHPRRTMNHMQGHREAPLQRCREGGLHRVVVREEFIPDCTRLSASCHSDQASSYNGADYIWRPWPIPATAAVTDAQIMGASTVWSILYFRFWMGKSWVRHLYGVRHPYGWGR